MQKCHFHPRPFPLERTYECKSIIGFTPLNHDSGKQVVLSSIPPPTSVSLFWKHGNPFFSNFLWFTLSHRCLTRNPSAFCTVILLFGRTSDVIIEPEGLTCRAKTHTQTFGSVSEGSSLTRKTQTNVKTKPHHFSKERVQNFSTLCKCVFSASWLAQVNSKTW